MNALPVTLHVLIHLQTSKNGTETYNWAAHANQSITHWEAGRKKENTLQDISKAQAFIKIATAYSIKLLGETSKYKTFGRGQVQGQIEQKILTKTNYKLALT